MKTSIYTLVFTTVFISMTFAQDRTIVTSTSPEISDNLDLKAVASIFGDSENLEDFERRLNDPKMQISNLDLNNDRQVDYLRVIESVEGNTHLIIVQSVLNRDVYQDVATIEVERDQNNNVQVQVVGDVYMYGHNYIYEPVYVRSPMIYNTFWVTNYRPYYSGWYWNYYPTYYYAWTPFPIFRYRNHIHHHINIHNHYNYVNIRRSDRAVALYSTRRSNGYERQYPNRSFAYRNANVSNHYELNQTRTIRNAEPRNSVVSNTRNQTPRSNSNIRTQANSPRTNFAAQNNAPINSNIRSQVSTPRTNSTSGNAVPRTNSNIRNEASTPRTMTGTSSPTPRSHSNTRGETSINPRIGNTSPRAQSNVSNTRTERSAQNVSRTTSPRISQRIESNSQRNAQPRSTAARTNNSQRSSSRG